MPAVVNCEVGSIVERAVEDNCADSVGGHGVYSHISARSMTITN